MYGRRQRLGFSLVWCLTLGQVFAQQIEMFPPGPWVLHCRAAGDPLEGGDDDSVNIWYFGVDARVADGTSAPDFFIHLFDGDNNANFGQGGRKDYDRFNAPGHSVFEYRLYGGPGAATVDEAAPGLEPLSFSGLLIDIDSDPFDDTLRTDDADDLQGDDPENLRHNGFSLIAVDMDATPGDFVDGEQVYKFVVDGRLGPGGEWNRYEIQVSRDAGRDEIAGLRLYTHELTLAGRSHVGGGPTALVFRIPPTVKQEVDLQTFDMDRFSAAGTAVLHTRTFIYDDFNTYESGDGFVGGVAQWTSLNQPVSFPFGNGFQGFNYPTAGEEGAFWRLVIDSIRVDNPFSIRLLDCTGAILPIEVRPRINGQSNGDSATLFVDGVGDDGESGPFFVGLDPGQLVTLDWRGPAHSDLLLLRGPRHTGNRLEGCLGFLDIGTPPSWIDVEIIATSAHPSFRLDAFGRARQDVSLPMLPPGPLGNIQGVVYQPVGPCPWLFTAAFYLTVY